MVKKFFIIIFSLIIAFGAIFAVVYSVRGATAVFAALSGSEDSDDGTASGDMSDSGSEPADSIRGGVHDEREETRGETSARAPETEAPPETSAPVTDGGDDGVFTVLIDPGHGFDDVGCSSEFLDGVDERDITLIMARTLRDKLSAKGIRSIIIHDGVNFPSFAELKRLAEQYDIDYDITKCVDNNIFSAYERTVYANILKRQYDVDFYISLHVNSMENSPERSGFEIDYCTENPYSAESKVYFDSIIASVKKSYPLMQLWDWEDSWENAFIVTKFPEMPSLLFEMGFATNKDDAAMLQSYFEQGRLMQAVADGIAALS